MSTKLGEDQLCPDCTSRHIQIGEDESLSQEYFSYKLGTMFSLPLWQLWKPPRWGKWLGVCSRAFGSVLGDGFIGWIDVLRLRGVKKCCDYR